MIFLIGRLEGEAQQVLDSRFSSPNSKTQFSGLAEMVQVLDATYGDKNRASKARVELSKLKYKPGDSETRFKTQFLALCDK